METVYDFVSSETTNPSGETTKTETSRARTRFTLGLDYNLLPKLNLDTILTWEKELADVSGDVTGETDVTRFRPSVWLRLRDPILRAEAGYDLQEETVKIPDGPRTTLTRESYLANLDWRPVALPSVGLRYSHTITRDDPRTVLDTTEDYLLVKPEYRSDGLQAHYASTYIRTDDGIRDSVSTLWSHEGRLLYSTTLLDGRISITTDNLVVFTELDGVPEIRRFASTGLSALDDTPLDGPPLETNSALVDGNVSASTGVNLGYPGPGGDFRPRNLGIDFLAEVPVNRLRVFVDGWGPAPLPSDITTFFSWDVYTSTDNQTWTFHAAAIAFFPVFDRRFELTFPPVTTRFIKVVTRPLPGGVIIGTDSSLFPSIFVTELQSFETRPAPEETTTTVSQLLQTYSLDVRVLLLRVPSLYYRFNASYYRLDSDEGSRGQTRYIIANGLVLAHRLSPIFSTSATTWLEVGEERNQTRTALRYYASLTATPLPTLTDTLALTGNVEWLGGSTTTSHSVVLYNVAQLYRGIDVNLNLGTSLTTRDSADGESSEQLDFLLNVGTDVSPRPDLNLNASYGGRISQSEGGAGGSRDTTEHRLDVGLSFSPFPALILSGQIGIAWRTGEETIVRQNYGLTWAPFPGGRLQLSLSYAEDYLPDRSRLVATGVRWYYDARRRSYLEARYQYDTTESGGLETESHLASAGLRILF